MRLSLPVQLTSDQRLSSVCWTRDVVMFPVKLTAGRLIVCHRTETGYFHTFALYLFWLMRRSIINESESLWWETLSSFSSTLKQRTQVQSSCLYLNHQLMRDAEQLQLKLIDQLIDQLCDLKLNINNRSGRMWPQWVSGHQLVIHRDDALRDTVS